MGQRLKAGTKSLEAGSVERAQPTKERRCGIKNRAVGSDRTFD
jgi:hypothetical protein